MAHILAVDDDAAILKVVRLNLERAGHQVEVRTDPTQVLDLLAGTSFDLLVLDVMMPGLDGLALCERVRAAGVETPILFLTAKNSSFDVLAGYAAGAQAYLPKPFQGAELLEKVRYALGQGS